MERAAFAFEGDDLFVACGVGVDRNVEFGISLEGGTLHESCGDNAADDGSGNADEGTAAEAESGHECQNDKSHAECCAEVGKRHELVFLEIAREVLVFGEGDDGWVVAEECHQRAQGSECLP